MYYLTVSSSLPPTHTLPSMESLDETAAAAAAAAGAAATAFHISGSLSSLLSSTQAALLRPLQFFVAWQGVLTIAYSGFPPSLCQLKKQIEAEVMGVIKENPGSLWPKTALACLKDKKRLSMLQLEQLRQICSEESNILIESPPITLENLTLVVYENCCLERQLFATKISLRLPVDESEPDANQKSYVEKVMKDFQAEYLEEYYFHASKDGNRSAHYRNCKAGVSLVHFLENVPIGIARFRRRVEASMPGFYDWFSEESLHITLRALL